MLTACCYYRIFQISTRISCSGKLRLLWCLSPIAYVNSHALQVIQLNEATPVTHQESLRQSLKRYGMMARFSNAHQSPRKLT
jgi:hypothetical protein